MKFATPIWLLIGTLVILALIFLRVWLTRRKNRELKLFAEERLIPLLTHGVSVSRRRIKTTLLLLGIAGLFLALARPQWGTRREEVSMQGIDILIALDTSRSMLASDVSPNRLERSKLAIHDFTSSMEAARIGLLPFAGDAFLLCPLTLDRAAFESSLNDLDTDIISEGGTDIARAIKEAEKVFEKGSNQKILLLITDGEDLEGGAIEAARQAADQGITIHTVGVGTPSGKLILLDRGRPLTDREGEAVRSKLDEQTLGKIASLTGGMYAPLVGNIAGLEQIRRKKLESVSKSELDSQTKEIPIERYQWPLTLSLILLAFEFCLGSAKRAKKTQTPALVATAVVIFISAVDVEANTSQTDPKISYNEGTQLWAKGKFSEAEQKFHEALSCPDLRLQNRAYYNLGNTRYRLGQAALKESQDRKKTTQLWEQAIESFDAALQLQPDDQDATYNKAFVQKKLDELKKEDKDKDKEDKEDKADKEQEEEDQKNKDQQDKDQKDKDKNKDQQDKDQKDKEKDKDQQNKDQQSKDQQDKDEQGKKDKPNPDQKDGEDKEAQNQEDQEGKEGEEGEEGEDKKQQPKNGEQAEQQAQPNAEQRVPGKMTQEEAKRLLESLTEEEGKIRIAAPRRASKPGQPRRPKRDW